VEEDNGDLHALLERAAKLRVKAGYSAYGPVKIKVAGKEKSYGFTASNVYNVEPRRQSLGRELVVRG